MPLEIGQRVTIRRPGQSEDGWLGYVEALSAFDVMVRLDRPTTWGRAISFRPHEVFPAPSGESA